jgi:hypothetical protein
MDLLVDALESCTDGYALGCLYFVSSEHPYLNPAHSQRLYRSRNLILQFVLNPSDPNQVHVML